MSLGMVGCIEFYIKNWCNNILLDNPSLLNLDSFRNQYDILNIYGFGIQPFQIDHFKIHIFKYKSKFKYSNTTL